MVSLPFDAARVPLDPFTLNSLTLPAVFVFQEHIKGKIKEHGTGKQKKESKE